MSKIGSALTLAAALFIAVANPAAAENVLRFTGKDAWAATMDPHSYTSEDNKGGDLPGLRGVA